MIFLFRKKSSQRQFVGFCGENLFWEQKFTLLFRFFLVGERERDNNFQAANVDSGFSRKNAPWTTDEHTENGPSLSIQTRKDIKYLLLLGRVSKYNLARPNEETNLPRDYSRMRRRSRDISLCFLACFLLSLFPLYRLSIGDDYTENDARKTRV